MNDPYNIFYADGAHLRTEDGIPTSVPVPGNAYVIGGQGTWYRNTGGPTTDRKWVAIPTDLVPKTLRTWALLL